MGSILEPNTLATGSYLWGLIAQNASGSSALSSPLMLFTVGAPPASPTPIGPSGSGISATPTYTFNAVSGATSYYYYRWNSVTGGFYSRVYTATECGVPSGTGVGSILEPNTLAAGSYYWGIVAQNSSGSSALSAPLMAFTTP